MMGSTVYRLSPLMLYEAHLYYEDPGFSKKKNSKEGISQLCKIFGIFSRNFSMFTPKYHEILKQDSRDCTYLLFDGKNSLAVDTDGLS